MGGAAFVEQAIDRAIEMGADAAQAERVENERFELDADTGGVNLLRSTTSHETTLTVLCDARKGSAVISGDNPDDLGGALRDALAAAEAAPADEANRIAPANGTLASHHGPTEFDREAMFDAVTEHLAAVKSRYPAILTRHAIYAFADRHRYFANSNGLVAHERRGAYQFSTLFGARREAEITSFNYAGAQAYEGFEPLMSAGSVERCLQELVQSLNSGAKPVPEKFVGDVILTPDCVSMLLPMVTAALGGYALLAQTSPYGERLGEPIASPAITLRNQPRHQGFPSGSSFDQFGLPTRDLEVIKDGTLAAFLVDFYCANKLDREMTAGATNLVVAPGEQAIADIVAATRRGIWLARFSGGQPNHRLDFSGVAKNSFYIEDGEIRHPLVETMVSGNLQDLLMAVRAVSRESVNFGGSQLPFIAAGGVTISSG